MKVKVKSLFSLKKLSLKKIYKKKKEFKQSNVVIFLATNYVGQVQILLYSESALVSL